MGLLIDIVVVCGAYLAFCLGRLMWHVGTERSFENRRLERQAEIDVMECQIVLALIKCAETNPKAAEILLARERARRVPLTSPDYVTYRRLFDHELGGEPRDEPAAPDESAKQQRPLCDDSVTGLFAGQESDESAKPEEIKP